VSAFGSLDFARVFAGLRRYHVQHVITGYSDNEGEQVRAF